MKILVLICFSIIGFSAVAQDDALSRDENIILFNEAQSCYKESIQSSFRNARTQKCAKTSLEIGKFLFEPDSQNIAALTYNYGNAARGNEAKLILKTALALYEALHGKDSPELIDLLIDLGEVSRALTIAKESFGKESILYADVILAEAMSGSSRVSSKTRFAKAAYEIYSKKNGPESVGATLASFQLGKFKMAQGKYKSSIPYFLQATKNSNVANYAHAFLAQAYDRTNQRDKATEHVLIVAKQLDITQDQDYLPLFVRSPDYPLTAQRKGIEGYAVVELTVSKEGLVLNPIVIEEKPKGKKFGKQALKAASSLRYIPRFEDGEPVEVAGVLYKYTFQMAR